MIQPKNGICQKHPLYCVYGVCTDWLCNLNTIIQESPRQPGDLHLSVGEGSEGGGGQGWGPLTEALCFWVYTRTKHI